MSEQGSYYQVKMIVDGQVFEFSCEDIITTTDLSGNVVGFKFEGLRDGQRLVYADFDKISALIRTVVAE